MQYYTASIGGINASHNMFIVTIEDAMKFCSDDRTKGKLYGKEWMYVWTTAVYYLSVNDINELVFREDNGSQNHIIKELGITIFNR